MPVMRDALAAALLALTLSAAAAPLPSVRNAAEVLHAFRPDAGVRVVNVWATWCVPCVAEIGDLQAISERFRGRGVEVIGLSLDDAIPDERSRRRKLVTDFLAKHRVGYRNLYFTGRPSDLADELRFDGSIPITIVFDRDGRELLRNEGALDRKAFGQKLETLLQRRKR
jgi:thiol-disulfide isomerase/thioredoxin